MVKNQNKKKNIKTNNKTSKKEKKKTAKPSLGTIIKKVTIKPNNIFAPSLSKIVITSLLSLLIVFGWISLIDSHYFTTYYIFLYIIISFVWITFSGILSCLFVYFSNKNIITRILGHFVKTLFIIFVCAIMFSVFIS